HPPDRGQGPAENAPPHPHPPARRLHRHAAFRPRLSPVDEESAPAAKLPAEEGVCPRMNDMDPYDPRDPVWKLLGHASRAEPSAFFARNVAREARLLPDAPRGLRLFFAGRRLAFAAAGTALAAVALALLVRSPDPGGSD